MFLGGSVIRIHVSLFLAIFFTSLLHVLGSICLPVSPLYRILAVADSSFRHRLYWRDPRSRTATAAGSSKLQSNCVSLFDCHYMQIADRCACCRHLQSCTMLNMSTRHLPRNAIHCRGLWRTTIHFIHIFLYIIHVH